MGGKSSLGGSIMRRSHQHFCRCYFVCERALERHRIGGGILGSETLCFKDISKLALVKAVPLHTFESLALIAGIVGRTHEDTVL